MRQVQEFRDLSAELSELSNRFHSRLSEARKLIDSTNTAVKKYPSLKRKRTTEPQTISQIWSHQPHQQSDENTAVDQDTDMIHSVVRSEINYYLEQGISLSAVLHAGENCLRRHQGDLHALVNTIKLNWSEYTHTFMDCDSSVMSSD